MTTSRARGTGSAVAAQRVGYAAEAAFAKMFPRVDTRQDVDALHEAGHALHREALNAAAAISTRCLLPVQVRQSGVSSVWCPSEYAGPVLDTPFVLSDVVEAIADWDVACPHQARALGFRRTPDYGLHLFVTYRTPMRLTWHFGSRLSRQAEHRHFAASLHTGVITSLPRGPLGVIVVRVKPEAAARLVGERPRHFLGGPIGLDDLFGASPVSLLEEKLSEATTSAERFSHMRTFLLSNLRPRRAESVVSWAAALLRRDPCLRVRQLAARLDVSERHLCRDFSAMFGMSPKQFARIARIGKVLSARAEGATWADIAYATGFTDQAHMINDFTAIVGVSPAELGHQLTRSPGLLRRRFDGRNGKRVHM